MAKKSDKNKNGKIGKRKANLTRKRTFCPVCDQVVALNSVQCNSCRGWVHVKKCTSINIKQYNQIWMCKICESENLETSVNCSGTDLPSSDKNNSAALIDIKQVKFSSVQSEENRSVLQILLKKTEGIPPMTFVSSGDSTIGTLNESISLVAAPAAALKPNSNGGTKPMTLVNHSDTISETSDGGVSWLAALTVLPKSTLNGGTTVIFDDCLSGQGEPNSISMKPLLLSENKARKQSETRNNCSPVKPFTAHNLDLPSSDQNLTSMFSTFADRGLWTPADLKNDLNNSGRKSLAWDDIGTTPYNLNEHSSHEVPDTPAGSKDDQNNSCGKSLAWDNIGTTPHDFKRPSADTAYTSTPRKTKNSLEDACSGMNDLLTSKILEQNTELKMIISSQRATIAELSQKIQVYQTLMKEATELLHEQNYKRDSLLREIAATGKKETADAGSMTDPYETVVVRKVSRVGSTMPPEVVRSSETAVNTPEILDLNQSVIHHCIYYRNGHCKWGSDCRFIHEKTLPSICKNHISDKGCHLSPEDKCTDLHPQKCKRFAKGLCNRGAKCNYFHASDSPIVSLAGKPERVEPGPIHNVPVKRTENCRYFKQGYCRNGPNCRFIHKTGSD